MAAAELGTASSVGLSGPPHPGLRPWLEVRGLTKEFAGVRALSAVDFDIWRGRVHGVVGANGAGKSTFIRCLAGLVAPDAGTISVGGEEVAIHTPHAARNLGFAFIHQELNLVPHFSGLKNILLGRPKRTRLGIIDWRASRREIQSVVERLGITFSLDQRVDELTVTQRWLISIAGALVGNAILIAMDEPTASLSPVETERVFSVVRELAASDVAVLYVSHRLGEVLELSDTISVFRDGHVTRRASRGDLNRMGLVREIIGRDLQPEARGDAEARERRAAMQPEHAPLLQVRGLSRGNAVRGATFEVRRGEVVGLGGLVGSGRTEVARLLAGVDQPDGGEIVVEGRRMRMTSTAVALSRGIAFVPEERRSEGLFLDRSVAFNLNIGDLRPLRRVEWLPVLHQRRARTRARQLSERLGIKITSVGQQVSTLSGGNQQKILIARWLTRHLKLLILDELSRGVDVGSRAEIHAIVRELAAAGTAILAISSETEELVELCDRIIVLAEGRVAGEVQGSAMTHEGVTALCYAHADEELEAIA
jgi:ribose transport system ATP-binding protein